jgi:hypothetical protein
MVSNYGKEPIFLLERTWEDNTKLPEKYKFQGTNTWNKTEVNIDSGTLGMEEPYQNSTRQELDSTGAGPGLSRNSRTFWAMDIAPPGLRSSQATSPNRSKTSPKLPASLNAVIRRKTSTMQSPFFYARYLGIKNLATDSIFTCSREVTILFERI